MFLVGSFTDAVGCCFAGSFFRGGSSVGWARKAQGVWKKQSQLKEFLTTIGLP